MGGIPGRAPARTAAVGLVRHGEPDSEPRRRRACLRLAALAHREGYTLVRTFELDGSPLRDGIALARLAELSDRGGVGVVLVSGPLPEPLLRELREGRKLQVVTLPES